MSSILFQNPLPVYLAATTGVATTGTPTSTVLSTSKQGSTNDVASSVDNTDAEITYAAIPGACHVISQCTFAYSGDTSTGNLSITVGGQQVFLTYITSAGCGVIVQNPPLRAPENTAVVVSLNQGGSGIGSSLSVRHYVELS